MIYNCLIRQLVLVILIYPVFCAVGRFNPARGQPTWQSSNIHDDWGLSDNAVDGCYHTSDTPDQGCCSHTNATRKTWWAVDLGKILRVFNVLVTTNGNSSGPQLQDFTVYGSDVSYNPSETGSNITACGHYIGDVAFGTTVNIACGWRFFARYIIIQKRVKKRLQIVNYPMVLCEVEVMAACPDGLYGENCSEVCPPNCKLNKCIKTSTNGRCTAGLCISGFNGTTCSEECGTGTFGENCKYSCPSVCLGGACHPRTGTCDTCLAGYENTTCYVAGRYNAAVGRPTFQSSHASAGFAGPQAAVDSCYSQNYSTQCCTHTGSRFINPSWWAVDLGQPHAVYAVTIFRPDGNIGDRLRNLTITGSNVTYDSSHAEDAIRCAYHKDPLPSEARIQCEQAFNARFITIQKTVNMTNYKTLSMCEVVVEAACPDGRYGEKCSQECSRRCKHPCNKVTGYCPEISVTPAAQQVQPTAEHPAHIPMIASLSTLATLIVMVIVGMSIILLLRRWFKQRQYKVNGVFVARDDSVSASNGNVTGHSGNNNVCKPPLDETTTKI